MSETTAKERGEVRTVLHQAEHYLRTGEYIGYCGTRDADHRMAVAAQKTHDYMVAQIATLTEELRVSGMNLDECRGMLDELTQERDEARTEVLSYMETEGNAEALMQMLAAVFKVKLPITTGPHPGCSQCGGSGSFAVPNGGYDGWGTPEAIQEQCQCTVMLFDADGSEVEAPKV